MRSVMPVVKTRLTMYFSGSRIGDILLSIYLRVSGGCRILGEGRLRIGVM